jgi:hypothetical protein
MPNDKARENYKKRLEYCQHQARLHSGDSGNWIIAIEVYFHLMNCHLTHSGGNPTCQWTGVFDAGSRESSHGTQSTS